MGHHRSFRAGAKVIASGTSTAKIVVSLLPEEVTFGDAFSEHVTTTAAGHTFS